MTSPSLTAAEAVIAEADGEVLGFALFFHNFSTWTGKRGLYLEDLYVSPEARGLGAGKALLDNSPALAVEMSRVGYAQQVIETARTEGSAASTTLQTARNQMREADPFATSAAISEAETKLQSLYSVIGRLSQLKLADYI